MFLYDWKKIFDESTGSPLAIYLIFKMLVTNQIPANKYDKIYKYSSIDFSGESFLVHADLLLFNAYKYSYREIAQYLAVASLRPLADYLATGKTTLDLVYLELDLELINDNRLLHIENNTMFFKYEEATEETIH